MPLSTHDTRQLMQEVYWGREKGRRGNERAKGHVRLGTKERQTGRQTDRHREQGRDKMKNKGKRSKREGRGKRLCCAWWELLRGAHGM